MKSMLSPYVLHPDSLEFPNPELALSQPDGLLAIGGDLCSQRLMEAYRVGIFPWYQNGDPICWWSPDPRMVIFTDMLRITRSLHKKLRKGDYRVSFDLCCVEVIEQCAAPRKDSNDTWITAEMQAAYADLHSQGVVHSVEVWMDGELAGGLYGVSLGTLFFGESMFSRRTDASKIALVHLAGQLRLWGFPLIDCQVANEHLRSLGGINMSRRTFQRYLRRYGQGSPLPAPWRLDWCYPGTAQP